MSTLVEIDESVEWKSSDDTYIFSTTDGDSYTVKKDDWHSAYSGVYAKFPGSRVKYMRNVALRFVIRHGTAIRTSWSLDMYGEKEGFHDYST
jgi:hypothetical protein